MFVFEKRRVRVSLVVPEVSARAVEIIALSVELVKGKNCSMHEGGH